MNGFQNGKSTHLERPLPGCLGRVVNLFDLSTGVAGNRLLTDKPHRDGSPLSRSRSDVARTRPISEPSGDKVMVSEQGRTSNRKSNGTPMKMLIDQEMSKDAESIRNHPSLVAKLMGLDPLPQQQQDSAVRRSQSRDYSRSHSDRPMGHRPQGHGIFDMQIQQDNKFQEQNEYRDVYEVWQQSQEVCVRNRSPQKERHTVNTNDKKMALVRQNFVEAKCLATDEKLRQSKQFQDALEVLSSNKDLFIKFLQEPNSLFSQDLHGLHSVPPPPGTKRITVLKPCKVMDNHGFAGPERKIEKEVKKSSQMGQITGWNKDFPSFSPPANWKVDDNLTQPTKIIVLKPNHAKPRDIDPPSSSPTTLCEKEFCGNQDYDEPRESREVAQGITIQMREDLSGHRRDESLPCSMLSNGYVGDDSSFSKSEIEYAAENYSDSEVTSPASKHSWDHVNRYGSPYSSSFSRASYSPESSVCREAKKRLSERWAMMASTGSSHEQRHVRRSSSTLGEMLALSDTKKYIGSEEEVYKQEQESRKSNACLNNELNKDQSVESSARDLLRSKSLPVSGTVHGAALNIEEDSDPEVSRTHIPGKAKARSTKSSFTGKVSSLFFSRNKKSNKEKSGATQFEDESQLSAGMLVHSPVRLSDGSFPCNDCGLQDGALLGLHKPLSATTSAALVGIRQKQDYEAGLSVMKPAVPVNPGESQDQPSPNSVLKPLFVEDENLTFNISGNTVSGQQGAKLPANSIKSNLIDKSPPIESVARTLSRRGSSVEAATPLPSKTSLICHAEEEEQEWLFYVRELLSAAGLNHEMQSDSFIPQWHSPENPLDPSLRDTYIDLNDKEIVHEVKRRQWRSVRKLVFDCVNAALVDITGHGLEANHRTIYCGGVNDRLSRGASTIMVDQVWSRMKEWFSGDMRCVMVDSGYCDSLVVETVVRKEVVGGGWIQHMRLEIDNVEKEIETKLLEELVQEAVVELTGNRQ